MALPLKDAQFDICHVQPAVMLGRVVQIKTFDKPPPFLGLERIRESPPLSKSRDATPATESGGIIEVPQFAGHFDAATAPFYPPHESSAQSPWSTARLDGLYATAVPSAYLPNALSAAAKHATARGAGV